MRVVIADDHPLFREGLEGMLEALGVSVVASVGDGEAAVEAVRQHDPDVVLMDLHMPRLTGIAATERISRECPRSAVLVLTMSEQPESLHGALRAGARGYLLKEASRADIARALDAVTRGEVVVGSGAAAAVRSLFERHPSAAFPQLSDRELDVLRLLASGADNAEIGRSLFLAEKTVRNRVSSILSKLQVHSRAEAVAHARDAGLEMS